MELEKISEVIKIIFKTLVKTAVVAVIAFYVIQARNQYCINKETCRPFYIKRFAQKLVRDFPHLFKNYGESNQVRVNFFALTSKTEISIQVSRNSDMVEIDQPKIISLKIINNSKSSISILPSFYTSPRSLQTHIIQHQCPCSTKINLKPNEIQEVKMIFEIDRKIDPGDTDSINLFLVF